MSGTSRANGVRTPRCLFHARTTSGFSGFSTGANRFPVRVSRPVPTNRFLAESVEFTRARVPIARRIDRLR